MGMVGNQRLMKAGKTRIVGSTVLICRTYCERKHYALWDFAGKRILSRLPVLTQGDRGGTLGGLSEE